MTTKDEFLSNFDGHDAPEELLTLWEFEQGCERQCFSDGFELGHDFRSSLSTWSDDPSSLNRLMPFGLADASGSMYGLWISEVGASLSQMPVVVFGSEGGIHVVAENAGDFLRLLTFDCEPMIDLDEASYYKDPEDFEPSPKSESYRAWLAEQHSLEPVDEAEIVQVAGQAAWDTKFKAWLRDFKTSTD